MLEFSKFVALVAEIAALFYLMVLLGSLTTN